MKIWTIFQKECRDAIRDRRALGVAVVTMLAGPLLVAFVLTVVASQETPSQPIDVHTTGAERAPDLIRFLSANGVREDKSAHVRLTVSTDFRDQFLAGRPATVTVDFDSSTSGGRSGAERLRSLVARYASEVGSLRLLARGVDPAAASPLEIRVFDHAQSSPRTAAAVAMIPMFLLMAIFLGSMNLAIDATAGERERNSLESLLLHPVPTRAIAMGKWLATFAFAASSAAGMLIVLRVVFEIPALRRLPVQIDLGASALLKLGLLLLPFAALAAALQLTVALRSRSFKEAQGQVSLLLFAPMLPGFLFAFEPPASGAAALWLPVVGHQLLASRILEGAGVPWSQNFLLGLVCVAAALALVLRLSGKFASFHQD